VFPAIAIIISAYAVARLVGQMVLVQHTENSFFIALSHFLSIVAILIILVECFGVMAAGSGPSHPLSIP
jgi:branched-subunit amino acid transport protein AzlD